MTSIDRDDDSALPDELRLARYAHGDIYDEPGWYDVDLAGYRAEEAFYRLVLRGHLKPGGVFVELGSGTGRLALRFAAEGFCVHGVEPSPLMRALFQEKRARALSQAPPPSSSGPSSTLAQLVVEDATAATFVGPRERIDVVGFPFNGLLHVMTRADLIASFVHVHERLSDDGRFALDVTGPYWDAMLFGPTAWGRSDERTHPLTGKLVRTADRSRYERDTRAIQIDIRYVVAGEREGAEIMLRQYMWTWQEILGALAETGFVVDLIFGDVDMAPFDEGSSRLLVSCRKAAT